MPTIQLRKGDDLSLDVAFTDRVSGDAVSMDGWLIAAFLQFPGCSAKECVAEWVTQSAGTALVSLAADETESLHDGEHELVVRLTSPAGKRSSSPSAIILVVN